MSESMRLTLDVLSVGRPLRHRNRSAQIERPQGVRKQAEAYEGGVRREERQAEEQPQLRRTIMRTGSV